MVRLIACFWVMLARVAFASDWSYGSFDNGSWFEAYVTYENREISLRCGGVSPGGVPLPQTDEPMMTAPYALDLILAQPSLGSGSFDSLTPPRNDVMVVSGTTGYTLPNTQFDEMNMQGWITPISFGDVLVRALMSGGPVAIDAAGQRLAVYDTTALPAALTQMIAFCDARWHATGEVLPQLSVAMVNDVRGQGVDITPTVAGTTPQHQQQETTPQVQRTDEGLWRAVQAHITRGCEGAARFDDGYAQAANFDGDSVADYVIFWENIECMGQFRRPFCGASQCAVDVFISSIYAPGDYPETVYAQAVSVVPGPQGRDLLEMAERLAVCQNPGDPPDCVFVWGWVEGDLRRLN